MSLRDLQLSDSYRSGRDRLARDFFVPCLSQATSYSRAVGYFTSGSLALVATGIQHLVARGGSIRLVASPNLNEEDVEQIHLGYQLRDVVARALNRELEAAGHQDQARLGYLGRLIAEGSLDIRIALARIDGRLGLYHEKIGVFADDRGDAVSFIGSMNETVQAHVQNLESFEVFRSWQPDDARRVAAHASDFEMLWNGENPSTEILELSEVANDRLRELATLVEAEMNFDDEGEIAGSQRTQPLAVGDLRIPHTLELREYQRTAVEQWFKNDGRGTLKMATGTGKTVTALATATQLLRQLQKRGKSQLTVVVCPYQHLVDQWAAALRDFGTQPICCYESFHSWAPALEREIAPLNLGALHQLAVVTTVATFRGEPFQRLLAKIEAPILLIADEVHNMGARRVRAALPDHVRYRLALSATPERWFDDDGTTAIFEYFGPTVFELPLAEAIQMGALSQYRYTPVPVTLDGEESELYYELTTQIGKLLRDTSEPGDDEGDDVLGALLRKRAGILAHCASKLPAFEREVRRRSEQWFQLVYCGEGKPPTRPDDRSQVDEVVGLLGRGLQQTCDRYVSETPREERRRLLQRFASGDDLRYLVSMRCLDEGVDLPDARVAYLLASSSNPRQFIQRRGRILRLPKDGQRKVAEIVDFIAVPSFDPPSGELAAIDQRLLRRELQRVVDFARLSINGPEALATLLDVRTRFHLLDM